MMRRRHFLFGSLGVGALLGAGLRPGLARAVSARERKFLFVTASGGWDPSWVLAPEALSSSSIWTDPEASEAEIGGHRLVDSPQRENVRRLFERYGERTCVLNGFEVRSVTHDRCRRILMTGSTASDRDGWSTRIGLDSACELPVVVASGPSYAATRPELVSRLGRDGQLAQLFEGSALERSDLPASPLSPDADALAQAWLDRRAAEQVALEQGGQARGFAEATELARAQAALLEEMDIDLAPQAGGGWVSVAGRAGPVVQLMQAGLTRCGMLEHRGLFDAGWDTHSDIEDQSAHWDTLALDLAGILEALETAEGEHGGSLLDETCVVVLSEMGRAPVLNPSGGKDHWTFTSALLLGDGVRPGRVGAFDEVMVGQPVDLVSGALDEGGTALTASHLGATLLALGGVDPDPALGDASPILAALVEDE